MKEGSKSAGTLVAKTVLREGLVAQFRKETEEGIQAILEKEEADRQLQIHKERFEYALRAQIRRTLGVHDDFVDLVATIPIMHQHLTEFMRTSGIQLEIVDDLEPGVRGQFLPKQNRVQVREGLGQAQLLKTSAHEFFHAFVAKLRQRGYSYREINIFIEEFFAELNGVRHEVKLAGLRPAASSWSRRAIGAWRRISSIAINTIRKRASNVLLQNR